MTAYMFFKLSQGGFCSGWVQDWAIWLIGFDGLFFFFWGVGGEGASGGPSLKGLGLKMTWVGWF